ncbi:methyltransferase domain-containing protein [Fibrella forsythiae]|uniref:Methyltransferase domain-containing protein n=1 Tax=Fibrella forsythiae TaxID=2817061 RepID=A0ABS3JJ27_9BACT|nr:methyltransferase domain-containing protein [Fibrella forsythiae]MBO0950013.1 methyltransferase domain-containing protein [Fibrella forsythiae]
MNKYKFLTQIKEQYDQGNNVIGFLKKLEHSTTNSLEDILISYDFQAGSYVKGYRLNAGLKEAYCQSIMTVLLGLGEFNSILEAGVGEATTLGRVVPQLPRPIDHVLGFDLSWSRIHYALGFMREQGIKQPTLFTGNLFQMPLADNSVDIVYTSHSVEPNGGREKEALAELYRVANRYVVLLEPSYELAGEEARARMIHHGYVTCLVSSAQELGYTILEHRLFDVSINPLNPTGLLIIEKNGANAKPAEPFLACPHTKAKLKSFDDSLFAEDSLLAYPKVQSIPCLLPQNAILATHFLNAYESLAYQ